MELFDFIVPGAVKGLKRYLAIVANLASWAAAAAADSICNFDGGRGVGGGGGVEGAKYKIP